MAKRIAVIDRSLCTHEKCGYVCMKVCPINRMNKECIVIEKKSVYPIISEELCSGCGICPKKCPVRCIKIINLTKDLDLPIFQYGVNSFRLYGLPLPHEDLHGAVSLVGKNGIGKTSALNILSGKLVPNFGEFKKKWKKEELLELMKPEMKKYFTELDGKLKISTKPQYIDQLRTLFKGTVEALLKKEIPKEKLDNIIELFHLKEILKRNVKDLSGGELQKLSIAIAYSKDAGIYYFDEVTNFLDIGERLKISIILKEFSRNKKVLLVDHDLTILDYVSDYISVFYGEESAYGVVSSLKSVRTGINEYLKGYLTSENIRFRDYEITFKLRSETETKAKVKYKYGSMEKKYEGFNFSSEEGSIREGEIIGIVGKNALGKSVFMKMLAGIEKPDKGQGSEFKVSYKPQYIHAEEVYVKDILKSGKLNNSIILECKRRLKLLPLMEKKLTELSGGELQRVALSLALSTEADVYLFDEPSAFLDIEQRFEFSALLKHVIDTTEKSAFVVDHDIVFIDSIANRIISFEGTPSIHGNASPPLNKKEGMNNFLKLVKITMRRDKDTNRPRINKPESVLDREQKSSGDYYYSN